MANIQLHQWFLPQFGKDMWTKIVEPDGTTHLPPWGDEILEWDMSFMEKFKGQVVEVYHQNRLLQTGIMKNIGKDEKGMLYFDVESEETIK